MREFTSNVTGNQEFIQLAGAYLTRTSKLGEEKERETGRKGTRQPSTHRRKRRASRATTRQRDNRMAQEGIQGDLRLAVDGVRAGAVYGAAEIGEVSGPANLPR